MDRYSYRDRDELRDAEPLFRSDLEDRPEAPEYKSIRPEGGIWSTVKRLLVPFAGIGFLIAKFKGLLFLLLKVKFVGTGLTMLLSVGAYALLYPLWFAVGLVALIWVHELGHILQLKREGMKASAPMFVPFLGAYIAMKEIPKNALVEARVGLAGPLMGTLGALAALGVYAGTDNLLFLGIAYVGFLLNLFNLLPILPLDGGRAVGAMSPAFWVLGAITMGALLFVTPLNLIFLVILLFVAYSGGRELWHRWRRRNTPERQAYNDIELRHRVMVGLVYFGLIAVLALLMAITYVPDPGGATPVLS